MITPAMAVLFVAASGGIAAWTLRLVRRDRLYVGYGVLVLIALGGCALVVAVGALRAGAGDVAATSPLVAACLVAIMAGAVALTYVLSQLTILSNRLTRLVQELAIRDADGDAVLNRSRATRTPG